MNTITMDELTKEAERINEFAHCFIAHATEVINDRFEEEPSKISAIRTIFSLMMAKFAVGQHLSTDSTESLDKIVDDLSVPVKLLAKEILKQKTQ